ncbi:MAG: hypothetical protein ACK5JN_06365 [Kluyvera sp.]|uniref:hypothetical protein n=1 Tax=Kluyvera sp. TaxID=1538228 RepID=UPI003A8C1E50
MSEKNSNKELARNIDKFDIATLLLKYDFEGGKTINAARRVRTPVVADRLNALRYSTEMFNDEITDVLVSSIATATLQFGHAESDKDDVLTLSNPCEIPVDFIIDNFAYDDIVRLNALMGKGIKSPHTEPQLIAAVNKDMIPLYQDYTYQDTTVNAALRVRRPVVRDHIDARGYSMERWGHAFGDGIIAGIAAGTMVFGSLSEIDGKPVLVNQVNIPVEFIINNFIYPDLLRLNRLLGKSPA